MKSHYLVVAIILILGACSRGVIKRDNYGTKFYSKQGSKGRGSFDPKKFSVIRKKLALLRFYNESPYGGDDLAVTATGELRREILRSGEFIIDPEGEKLFGNSKEVYAGGGVKLVQLARKAKLSGVNFVVFGRIKHARIRQKVDEIGFVRQMKSFTECKIEIRIFDVSSNKEIFTKIYDGYSDDKTYHFYSSKREDTLSYRQELLRYSTRVAVRKIIPEILDLSAKLDWMGRVARILGSKIYVNAGRQSGINIGDVLKVMTEGKEIYDPETGAMIGLSKGEIKGTLEVIDYFGPDGAVAILHSGGSVTEGDFVKLY